MSLRVPDISDYQGDLDLGAIDLDAIMVKATEGVGYVNPSCDKHIQQAITKNIPNGVYHFAHNRQNSAVEEANFLINNIRGYLDGTTLVVLDNEWLRDRNGVVLNDPTDVSWVRTFTDTVYNETGVRVVIYMSSSVINSVDWSPVYNDYGLWVAQYWDGAPDYNWDMSNAGPLPDVNWNSNAPYIMWQWTSVGRLDGYNGNLDLSIFYGDKSTWLAYARDQRQAAAPLPIPVLPPQPEQAPTPVPQPTPAAEPTPVPVPTPVEPTPAPVVIPVVPAPVTQPTTNTKDTSMSTFIQSLKSRKLILALIAAFVAFGNAQFGWGLTVDQVWSVVAPLLAYIGVEGAADIATRVNQQ